MRSIQPIVIDKFGTKGFVDAAGRNKTASHFLSYIRNARIENASITVRPGYREIVASSIGTHIRGITANNNNNELYVSTDGKFYKVDFSTTPNSLVEIGALSGDVDNQYIEFGKYTIILTGDSFPYVYDGTTLIQLSDANIPQDVNPKIGVAFSGFTAVAGNSSDTDNILYFSKPVSPSTQTNAYDWLDATAEQMTLQSPIVGLVGTLSNLFVFTKNTIEYLDKNSLTTIGGVASLFLTPLGEGDELISSRCAVGAMDKVFYITKNLEVKTVNYVPGTVDRSIGELSNRTLVSIKSFMNNIDPDQSNAFGYRIEEKIYWHLKEKDSATNSVVLIYDIENDAWLCDNNKYYSGVARLGDKYYAGSVLNSNVYEDEVGSDDNEGEIPFEIRTQKISFGNPVREKMFRGWEIAGELNWLTNISVETIVDGGTENFLDIVGSEIAVNPDNGIGSSEIGGEPIAFAEADELDAFSKVADHGEIRIDGKTIQLVIKESTPGSEFYIDYLSFFVQASGPYQLSDKL